MILLAQCLPTLGKTGSSLFQEGNPKFNNSRVFVGPESRLCPWKEDYAFSQAIAILLAFRGLGGQAWRQLFCPALDLFPVTEISGLGFHEFDHQSYEERILL